MERWGWPVATLWALVTGGTMLATEERRIMGKARGRPKRSERDDVTVKVDRTLVGKAKLIATHRGIPVAELLTELLRAPLDKAYAQMLRDLEASQGKEPGK